MLVHRSLTSRLPENTCIGIPTIDGGPARELMSFILFGFLTLCTDDFSLGRIQLF